MQSYNFYDTIKYFIAANAGMKPPLGNVFAINGHTIDVVVRGSKVVIRNVPVSGDVSKLYINQPVSLLWSGSDCIATGVSTSVSNSRDAAKINSNFPAIPPYTPGGVTIEKGSGGIRVKKRSITLAHLAFGLSGVGNSGSGNSDTPLQTLGTQLVISTADHTRANVGIGISPSDPANDDELFFYAIDGMYYHLTAVVPFLEAPGGAVSYVFSEGEIVSTRQTSAKGITGGFVTTYSADILKSGGDGNVYFKWCCAVYDATEKAGATLTIETMGLGSGVGAGGVTNGNLHDHIDGDGAPIKEGAILLSDVTTDDVSTLKHGFVPKLTAPAAGDRNVMGIDNGETGLSSKAAFTSDDPADLGTASPGTSLYFARADHVHGGAAGAVLPDAGAAGTMLISDGAIWTADFPLAMEKFIRRRLWIGI